MPRERYCELHNQMGRRLQESLCQRGCTTTAHLRFALKLSLRSGLHTFLYFCLPSLLILLRLKQHQEITSQQWLSLLQTSLLLVEVLKALLALCPNFSGVLQAKPSTLYWPILSEAVAAGSYLFKQCLLGELTDFYGEGIWQKSEHTQKQQKSETH